MFGLDRQIFYRDLKRQKIKSNKAFEIVQLVIDQRKILPRIGARKLYYILYNKLQSYNIGRDKFFEILRANHMMIVAKRAYHVTTNSHHRFRKHNNLIKDFIATGPEQVWVSDITYIGTRKKPFYLSLITDVYSKSIVGFNVANSLNTNGCLSALKQAIIGRKYKNDMIHHSDRGVQYCSNEYQKVLQKNNISCSMTQDSDPYENAIAERMNGILKQEFNIDKHDLDLKQTKKVINEAIMLYNNLRPHWTNFFLTPNQMHQTRERKYRVYKKENSSKQEFTTV